MLLGLLTHFQTTLLYSCHVITVTWRPGNNGGLDEIENLDSVLHFLIGCPHVVEFDAMLFDGRRATIQLYGRDATFERNLQKEIGQMLNVIIICEG